MGPCPRRPLPRRDDLAAEHISGMRWWRHRDLAGYDGTDLFSPRDIATPLAALIAALDHLDEPDARIVVPELCAALTDADPTAALMTRFHAAIESPADLHDPVGVALAHENVLGILQL